MSRAAACSLVLGGRLASFSTPCTTSASVRNPDVRTWVHSNRMVGFSTNPAFPVIGWMPNCGNLKQHGTDSSFLLISVNSRSVR